MFIFNKVSFCFLLPSEEFSNNGELLAIIVKISLKLHVLSTHKRNHINNKMKIMKVGNQIAVRGTYKCSYQVLACHVLSEEILLDVI